MTHARSNVPIFWEYMNPVLDALRELGGSATNQEIYEEVVRRMGLPDDQLEVIHNPDRGSQTEVGYRMAWARTYLKIAGYLENSRRGVWALTESGAQARDIDAHELARAIRSDYSRRSTPAPAEDDEGDSAELDQNEEWKGELLAVLLGMPPDAFERLCQRLLRESGFVEVRVTGRSGDGGIDGIGLLRLESVLSFHVIFQCKRYRGAVGPSPIRDFRGAMVGRADKGIFMTTGTFTRGALDEATRDGAPAIDLIDGNQMVEMLKKLELGVTTELVEQVHVNRAWFEKI